MSFKLPIFLVILLAASLISLGQQDHEQDFASLVAAAKEAQTSRNFTAAADAYQKAAQLRPDIPMLWANLGLMQEATGSESGAIDSFHKANRLDPSLYVPYLFLGIAYTRMNRPREAIPFLIKAESLNHRDPLAPLSLGRAYVADEKFAAAEDAFRRTLAINGKNSAAWFALGLAAINAADAGGWKLSNSASSSTWSKSLFADALQEQSRIDESIAQEKAVLSADSHFPCAHARLGFLYLAQHERAAALAAFAVEPAACSLADLGRAEVNLLEGDTASALNSLTNLWERDSGFLGSNVSLLVRELDADSAAASLVALDHRNATGSVSPALYGMLVSALRGGAQGVDIELTGEEHGTMQPAQGSAQNAEADAREGRYGRCTGDLADGMDRRSDRELLLLAGCAYMTGDYNRSSKASDLLLARAPNDPQSLYWSIKANEKLAFAALGHFEQLEPNSERTHLLLGDMYRQSHRYPQATAEYKAAADLAPQDIAPLFGLASTYVDESNLDEASATARNALAIDANDPELNVLVGQILVTQHNWIQAEEYLKRVTGVKPQMAPHLHFLLAQIYQNTGRMQQAVTELRLSLPGDDDGTAYYQLAQIYKSQGNKLAAQDALAHVREIKQKRHERALIAVQDLSNYPQTEIH